ncbi:MAG: OsmC family protein [Pseudomonadota bacterium]
MITKSGSAHWAGGLRDGKGTVTTESGALNKTVYTFAKRFEDVAGTNPEELLAAAHASCFSMALSNILSDYDMTADAIDTSAEVTLDPANLQIIEVQLTCKARIPGGDADKFAEAAEKAKEGCPVSKLFKARITLDASLD